MPRLNSRFRAIAIPAYVHFRFNFLILGVFLLLSLLAHSSFAGTTAPKLEWQDMSQLGASGEMDRTFQSGVQAYQRGEYDRAISIWRMSAEQGHPHAQFNLGVAHATGKGAEIDYVLAARWWQLAAYQGHTSAQYNLGLLYSMGQGVQQNISEARMWWYMAAMSGNDPAAQYYLGALAAAGNGETQDLSEAAWWWARSAGQGYEHAVKGLEILKQHGNLEIMRE